MTSVANPPTLTTADAEAIAAGMFGVAGQAVPLSSERDQNFRITTTDDVRFVLKVANAAESPAMLEAENAVMAHLEATGLVPAVVPTRDGSSIGRHGAYPVRLVTWLHGRPMHESPWVGDGLLAGIGRAIAILDRALASFDHPALRRQFYWDLADAPALMRERLPLVGDAELRRDIDRVLALSAAEVNPRLGRLRRGVIHNDANDHNVLVDPHRQQVTGIVDFGDMVVSHVVNDVAVAAAYGSLGASDPLSAVVQVVRGYHAQYPLNEDEIAAVFPLVCLRLGLSICVAAVQQAERPDDAYLSVSQAPIRGTLPRLLAIHPRLAHYRLRDACGLPPVPHANDVVRWLRDRARSFASVTGHDFETARVLGLDLSVGSPLVTGDPAGNTTDPFSRRLFAAIDDAGAVLGAGGYGEARLIYAADAYEAGAPAGERRTIHIGIDLTLPAGSPIFAPIDGVVHGFEDAGRFDYGPVVVLRHGGAPHPVFYTLYGHLSRESLDGLVIGKRIAAGKQFGAIGAPPHNGDWWPHLHFQVIIDMLDVPCNFNGVAPAAERRTWLSLCPDPNLILGIPESCFIRHRSSAEVFRDRSRLFGPNVRLSFDDDPFMATRGWMQYLFDEDGRRYVDAYNNVPHVGHSHPEVTQAVCDQLAVLNTNTRYLQEVAVEYASELAATLPAPLSVCYFTTSGTEANELALRLARAHTRRRDLIVMESAYHGHSATMIDISPYKHAGAGGTGAPDWVHVSPVPDVYRGRYRAEDAEAGAKYARDVEHIVADLIERGRGLCGYIAETCPSVAGQIILPAGYLSSVYRTIRAAGGVCIADEVQTGFGRMGTHFWAFQAHGVVPDILVLGKPIANGYPMGAVITTPEIAASFDNGMEFFSTFGGSTAACAAALATLRVTLGHNLQAWGLAIGQRLLSNLVELERRHALVGNVRGSGLFLGVELVRDRATLEPATTEAAHVVGHMRRLGVLAGTDGPHHNVIKLRGPMCLTPDDADGIVQALDTALGRVVRL